MRGDSLGGAIPGLARDLEAAAECLQPDTGATWRRCHLPPVLGVFGPGWLIGKPWVLEAGISEIRQPLVSSATADRHCHGSQASSKAARDGAHWVS